MAICHVDNQIYVSQWTQNLKHKILHSKQLVSYIAIVFLGLRCKSRESFDKVTVGTFNINSISSKFDKFKLIVSGLFDVIITPCLSGPLELNCLSHQEKNEFLWIYWDESRE